MAFLMCSRGSGTLERTYMATHKNIPTSHSSIVAYIGWRRIWGENFISEAVTIFLSNLGEGRLLWNRGPSRLSRE